MYNESDSGAGIIIAIALLICLYLYLKYCQYYAHKIQREDPKRYERAIEGLKSTSENGAKNSVARQRTSTPRVAMYGNNNIQSQKEHNLAEKSIFKLHGYSVSIQDGLTAAQRRDILRQMINNGVVSKEEAISFLEWNIKLRYSNKNFRLAISKWNEDLKYLRRL